MFVSRFLLLKPVGGITSATSQQKFPIFASASVILDALIKKLWLYLL